MENCAMEVLDDSKIKIEDNNPSEGTLGKQLIKLLNILELTGIPIKENRNCGRLFDLLLKSWYPIFLHLSLFYLWYATLSKGELDYAMVIDTVLPILPCIMWLIMRRHVTSLKLFFADLGKITSQNFISRNRCLMISTYIAVCFIFMYAPLLLIMRWVQGNVINTKEVFRILQEAIFPNTIVMLYILISYLLLQKLQFCKKMFQKCDVSGSAEVENLVKDYHHVAKCIETFENLFCNIAFMLVLHDFLVVFILVLDMIYFGEDFMEKILYEALTEIIFVIVSLGILSFCAGSISLEMASIKSVLLEKMLTPLDQNDQKYINLLLQKDACILTAGKAIVFDRRFLLKALFLILALVVFFCEIR